MDRVLLIIVLFEDVFREENRDSVLRGEMLCWEIEDLSFNVSLSFSNFWLMVG